MAGTWESGTDSLTREECEMPEDSASAASVSADIPIDTRLLIEALLDQPSPPRSAFPTKLEAPALSLAPRLLERWWGLGDSSKETYEHL